MSAVVMSRDRVVGSKSFWRLSISSRSATTSGSRPGQELDAVGATVVGAVLVTVTWPSLLTVMVPLKPTGMWKCRSFGIGCSLAGVGSIGSIRPYASTSDNHRESSLVEVTASGWPTEMSLRDAEQFRRRRWLRRSRPTSPLGDPHMQIAGGLEQFVILTRVTLVTSTAAEAW